MKKETELIVAAQQIRAIVTQAEYDRAAAVKHELKSLRQQMDDTFKPIIDKANKAHKEAIAQMKRLEAPVIEQERRLDPILAMWLTEQKRLHNIRLAELRAAKARVEAEALEAASKATEDGDIEGARDIVESLQSLTPEALGKPDTAGISTRTTWKFRIIDASKVPDTYKKIDEGKIGKVVRALGKNADIAGVETYPETKTVTRGVL